MTMQLMKRRGAGVLALAFLCQAWAMAAEPEFYDPKEGGSKKYKRPTPIAQEPPEFPYNMSRAGLVGEVMVEFIIDKEGRVINPFVVSSNNPWFERPAITTILKWKFAPAEVDGRKVYTRANQKLIFGEGSPGLWQVGKARDHSKQPPELQWEQPPIPVNTAFVVYPFEAVQKFIEGWTKINFLIGPDGQVVSAKLLEASTPEMGRAVLAMIDTWRFQPARKKDGTPSFALVGIEHRFSLERSSDVPVPDEAREILRVLAHHPDSIASARDLDQPLKSLSRRPPVYPTGLQAVGQPGQAMIEFFVDKNGDAQLPRIVSCSAPEFGYAAAQAVATWRFDEPKVKGKPTVVRVRIPMEFARSHGPAKEQTP